MKEEVLNNSPNYLSLAQRFISHQSQYTIVRNNLELHAKAKAWLV